MLERITTKIDLLNHRVGEAALWLVLAMIVFQFLIVLLSKVFGISFTPLDESIWYLNGLIFMLGAAYTLLHDRHVRVDIIYRTASSRYKAWIDFWACLIFIIPVAFMTWGLSTGFILDSWYNFSANKWILERSSDSSSSLPLIAPYKTIIWVYALLIALQAFSEAGKAWLYLSGKAQTYPLPRKQGQQNKEPKSQRPKNQRPKSQRNNA